MTLDKRVIGLWFGLIFYAMGLTMKMNEFGQVFFIGLGSLAIAVNMFTRTK